jgi:hypothetical protein
MSIEPARSVAAQELNRYLSNSDNFGAFCRLSCETLLTEGSENTTYERDSIMVFQRVDDFSVKEATAWVYIALIWIWGRENWSVAPPPP